MSALPSLSGVNRTWGGQPNSVDNVKVCGCRPDGGGAAHTGGRRPQTCKGGNRGRCGEAARQTLWGFRRWRSVAGSVRRHDETVRPVAIGVIGVAQRRPNLKSVVVGGARASLIIAGREPAKLKSRAGVSPRIDSGHDVSILITAVDAAGR